MGRSPAIKPMFPRGKWKILRGDTVYIARGRDAGATGVVTRVVRDEKRPAVVVEGRNLAKKHIKRTADNPGGTISIETPIHYSNVRLVDPVTKAPVRVAWRYLEDGSKVRVTRGAKASGSVLPRPDILAQRRVPLPLAGGKDTATAAAAAITHVPGSLPSLLRRGLATWRGFAAGGG